MAENHANAIQIAREPAPAFADEQYANGDFMNLFRRSRSSMAVVLFVSVALAMAVAQTPGGGTLPTSGATPTAAPLNPQFVKYMSELRRGHAMLAVTTRGHALGEIPLTVDLFHLKKQAAFVQSFQGALPASYDLRTYGKVTAVRDRGGAAPAGPLPHLVRSSRSCCRLRHMIFPRTI